MFSPPGVERMPSSSQTTLLHKVEKWLQPGGGSQKLDKARSNKFMNVSESSKSNLYLTSRHSADGGVLIVFMTCAYNYVKNGIKLLTKKKSMNLASWST